AVGAALGADGPARGGLVGEGGEVAVEGGLVRRLPVLRGGLAVDARARGLGVAAVVAALAQRLRRGVERLAVGFQQRVRGGGGNGHGCQPTRWHPAGPPGAAPASRRCRRPLDGQSVTAGSRSTAKR